MGRKRRCWLGGYGGKPRPCVGPRLGSYQRPGSGHPASWRAASDYRGNVGFECATHETASHVANRRGQCALAGPGGLLGGSLASLGRLPNLLFAGARGPQQRRADSANSGRRALIMPTIMPPVPVPSGRLASEASVHKHCLLRIKHAQVLHLNGNMFGLMNFTNQFVNLLHRPHLGTTLATVEG